MNIFVDVPETSLVDVLTFYVGCPSTAFEGLCQTPHMQMDYDPQEEEGDKIVCPFPAGKAYFINGILKRPFTDVQLLTALPKMSFDHALSLIKYLHFLIAAGEVEVSPQEKEAPSVSQTALWLSLLLETNYHQLVMSSEVAIHRLLLSCFTQVSVMIKFLEGMSDIELLARRIIKGKPLSKHTHSSANYSLERLVIS
ncbi:Nucleolar protein 11 [Chionoecetes opilio]|uniref:Nucleolar protein 11 n=1 Tax=Chionoecetes opilio TaxID=41210 RepID=A0A8J5CX64_CHIOP|nr:Nucleolar protein 11 [Chionoecetes opilio]